MGYYPEMMHSNWKPKIGQYVVVLDLPQSQTNDVYRKFIGQKGVVEAVRYPYSSDHTFVAVRFDNNIGYKKVEEMYSWRVGPCKLKPNWEV